MDTTVALAWPSAVLMYLLTVRRASAGAEHFVLAATPGSQAASLE